MLNNSLVTQDAMTDAFLPFGINEGFILNYFLFAGYDILLNLCSPMSDGGFGRECFGFADTFASNIGFPAVFFFP